MTDVALVTGASRGIGRAIALKLADDGFAIAVNYASSSQKAEAVVAQIVAGGGQAIAAQADVSDPDAVAGMFDAIGDELGPVSVLVNNAGVTDDGLLLRMSADQWDKVISTNLRSVFLCPFSCARRQLCVRCFAQRRGGSSTSVLCQGSQATRARETTQHRRLASSASPSLWREKSVPGALRSMPSPLASFRLT